MAYKSCKRLITIGRTDGMAEKLDVFYANGRLTTEEYNELVAMLEAATAAS